MSGDQITEFRIIWLCDTVKLGRCGVGGWWVGWVNLINIANNMRYPNKSPENSTPEHVLKGHLFI